jgi:hypothetical protein
MAWEMVTCRQITPMKVLELRRQSVAGHLDLGQRKSPSSWLQIPGFGQETSTDLAALVSETFTVNWLR